MGVAIARAAAERGARVLLVHGEMSVEPPQGVETLRATSTEEMHDAVLGAMAAADVLVMAAAVADFRAREPMHAKLTRGQGLSLELEPTPDILAEVAQAAGRRTGGPRPVLVGFAAETGSLDRATAKATRKGVDILVANDVLRAGSGFATETNEVTLIRPGRPPEPWPLMAKREVATRLVDLIAEELARRGHVPTEVPA